ncbi:MAG: DUF1848 domain-containing protein [Clostridiaceae bacterium]|jgi:hypothetical protein|nr:DUF1848 domain-containing protein [Clostridiaceae bacterium]
MIISASRWTDIPCHYGQWFLNRLKEGYVLTRNPFNNSWIYRVLLEREVVDCIVFWTKDPKNFIPYLEEIDALGYKYYFQFTLTPYDRTIEINLREKSEIIETFIELSERLGKNRIVWRYDPIMLTDHLNVDYHKKQFAQFCERLSPYTESVVISFVDRYAKIKKKIERKPRNGEIHELSEFIGKTAKEHGLIPKACCEEEDLLGYGIQKSSCIDKSLIESICGCKLDLRKDRNQRKGCGCVESIDIGAHNTCINGCVYCYANYSVDFCMKQYANHNPSAEMLTGCIGKNEKITEKRVGSNKSIKI